MKVVFYFFLSWAPLLSANQISIPETLVEISIYDLIKKEKKAYLGKDYGDKVKAVLMNYQTHLLEVCYKNPSLVHDYKFQLSIASTGIGEIKIIEEGPSPMAKKLGLCLQGELTKVTYPQHLLERPVSITFPMRLGTEHL